MLVFNIPAQIDIPVSYSLPQEAKSKSSQFSLVSVVFKIHLTRMSTKAQFTKINTTCIIENPLLTNVMDIISKLLLITLSQSTLLNAII